MADFIGLYHKNFQKTLYFAAVLCYNTIMYDLIRKEFIYDGINGSGRCA